MLRSKLACSLMQFAVNRSLLAKPRSRRLTRKQRNCGTEQLEVRQLLTGDFDSAVRFGSTGEDIGTAITTDASGNVYTTGAFGGTVDFDPGSGTSNLTSAGSLDIFVSKLDSAGNFVWAKRMGGATADKANGIAVDSSGNVYTTGYFTGTADFDPGSGTSNLTSVGVGFTDIFVSKLDSAGNFVWAKRMGGASSDEANGIAVDGSGNVYTTGYFNGTADFDPGGGTANLSSAGLTDIFVSKLDSAGNYVWAKKFGGSGDDVGNGIALDGSGNVHTTGSFTGTANFLAASLTSVGGSDIFVTKLDVGGFLFWAQRMGGTNGDRSYDIAVDDSGNVYTTGIFFGTADFDPGSGTANLTSVSNEDVFVSKLGNDGTFVWARSMGGSDQDVGLGIAVDGSENVYTTGVFRNTVDFDPGSGTTYLTSAGSADVFVSKLGSDGNFVWAKRMGGTSSDAPYGIAVDVSGNVYTTGSFYGTADFDPGIGTANLTSAAGGDIFVSKLSNDMLYTLPDTSTGDLRLRRDGEMLELWFKGTLTAGQYELRDSHPIAAIRSVRIKGSNAFFNSLTVDFAAGGAFMIDQGIHYAAGTSTSDLVQLVGVGNEGFTYQPSSAVAGSGKFLTYGKDFSFTGVEATGVSQTQALAIEPQGSADVLTVDPAEGFEEAIGARISGTTGGTAITPLWFDNVRDLTIDTGLFDGELAQSNDTVTFNTGSYEAKGLKNVFVRTGKGNDTLTANGPDIGLPVPGGAFWFLGGSGIDRLSARGNANWDLNDTRLVSAGGGKILHDDIEKSTLIGGVGKNLLNASLFSGDATLSGLHDNDVLRGGSGNDFILAGTGNDRIYGGSGDDNLQGQDGNDLIWGDAGEDTLTGGIGNDQLWGGDDNDSLSGEAGNDILHGDSGDDSLSGGDNNDQLYGDTGNDIVNGGNHNDQLFGGDGADTLNGDAGDDFLSGGTGNDSLAGGTGIDLYDLQGTSNAEDLHLQRVSSTSALFKRKPRGLSSVLEQDTITMDAADEFWVTALGGDDLITIDSLFTQLGSVDGGDGTDVCTGPAAWAKISC